MKLNINDLPNVIELWLDKVVIPKSDSLTKAVVFFLWLQHKENLNSKLETIAPLLGADNDKTLDLDKSYQNAKHALNKAGGSFTIPLINWQLDNDDLEILFSIARDKSR